MKPIGDPGLNAAPDAASEPLDFGDEAEAGLDAPLIPPAPRGLDDWLAGLARRLGGALRTGLARTAATAEPFMVAAGVMGVVGQVVFYVIWRFVFPQPYESLTLRLIAGLLALPVVFKNAWPERLVPLRAVYWLFAVLVNVPFLFAYLLLANGMSEVWLLSSIAGAFVLTFMAEPITAVALFIVGSGLGYLAWGFHVGRLADLTGPLQGEALKYGVILLFPLVCGGIVNHRLQRYRTLQRNFERRLRHITTEHARVVQEQYSLVTRFLSNVIVSRLRRFQTRHGLEEAIGMITRQEQRFCGIMQADVRSFTKLFGMESEFQVAQQIRRCFTEITEIGQDLAVMKPVGDSIFGYVDDEHGRRHAVRNILSLAIFFVSSLEKNNRTRPASQPIVLNFGIGVHAGEVIYGNLASDTLIDPTIIGLNVNKTARLEELTKAPALRDLVGPNAILLSDEIAFYGSDFIRPQDLIPIDLRNLGLQLRDFPQVTRIHALTRVRAIAYLPAAMDQIASQRARFAADAPHRETNRHRGIPYFYEMQGSGPNTTWLALIDVSAIPPRTVAHFVQQGLEDLECNVTDNEGQWLMVSTQQVPGEYDEFELEARIFEIIDALQAEEPRADA